MMVVETFRQCSQPPVRPVSCKLMTPEAVPIEWNHGLNGSQGREL